MSENLQNGVVADNKTTYTLEEIMGILRISRPTAKKLLDEHQFPWKRLNRGSYRIVKSAFDKWLYELGSE